MASNDIDSRWAGAIVWPINRDVALLVAGTDVAGNGKGHTCFVRVVPGSRLQNEPTDWENVILRDVVSNALLAIEDVTPGRRVTSSSATDLLNIGAVWIIPEATRFGKNNPRRVTPFDNITLTHREWDDVILRIHYGAIRYLDVHRYDWGKCCDMSDSNSSNPGVIIYEDLQAGYSIINKPPGVPVHGYVYNGVENVVHMYGECLIKRYPKEFSHANISVPQRLDHDTSGVLVVSTKSSFSSYMGKLLESKTKTSVKETAQSGVTTTASSVIKRYKCLLCMKRDGDFHQLKALKDEECVVTHYLSTRRIMPREFSEVPLRDDSQGDVEWLECKLRIAAVGFGDSGEPCVPVRGSTRANILARALWNISDNDTVLAPPYNAVTQVEVELLTGRTHQIRGQLAALGFPLVGDFLYGGGLNGVARDDRNSSRLGLHCCQLSFPNPTRCKDENCKQKGRQKLIPSSRLNKFRFDKAWWNKHIE